MSTRNLGAREMVIGPYRVVRRMAAGGLSDIFLAQRHGPTGYESTVVLKTLRFDRFEDPGLLTQLAEEARVASCLEHENIVRTLEVGREADLHYLVMEFVFGRTVQQIRDRCAERGLSFPVDHASLIARDGLAALHYAHHHAQLDGLRLGLVHRDVSPSNLIVGFDGVARLLDFGLAKGLHQLSRTQVGAVKGRFGYMSPEQVRRAPLDGRSDVFSLGVVLWEMLAGRALFEQAHELETLEAIDHGPVPLVRSVEPRVSTLLSVVVGRALLRPRWLRYGSAEGMRTWLARLDPRPEEQARDELQAWLRELFHVELVARDVALQRARREPTTFRMLRDSGFELLPEVTDPAVPASLNLLRTQARPPTPPLALFLSPGPFALLLLGLGVFSLILGVVYAPLPEQSSPRAYLFVTSAGVAEVLVDGQPVGSTPLVRHTLPAGAHLIQLRARERVQEVWLTFRPGQSRLVRASKDEDLILGD